jgi:16S rRNA (cytosine967-C5)-methyltransferase
MAGPKFKSARAIAIEVLSHYDPKRDYAGSILDGLQNETDQRQRATDLVFGTLRNRTAIDTVITTFSGRPVERIQYELLNIIRVGTYELIYCPSTEQYAIVNEVVASAKAAGSAKQTGFVNAVLRQITRHISSRQVILAEGDADRTLPQTPVTGCEFDTPFLPDRKTSPAEYLSMAFSLPEWLIAGWLAEFGEEPTRQICFASNRRPGIYLRPNPLRTTIEQLAEKLRLQNIDIEIVDVRCSMPDACRESRIENQESRMIRIISPQAISQLPGFAQGEFTVQDVSASKPVRMLNPKQGWTILDLCAAPGAKTAQLAEATGDSAKIIATDIDSRRLEMVKENITRLGVNSVEIVPYEELLGTADFRLPNADFQIVNHKSKIENRFDCVLLDVPCSNTGVLAKRVEVRYRIEQKAIRELAGLQSKLLRTAAEMLKPGGKICYSTCSIQKTENSDLIEDFLKENQNFTLESQQLILPSAEGFDHDGGYAAILAKRETK